MVILKSIMMVLKYGYADRTENLELTGLLELPVA